MVGIEYERRLEIYRRDGQRCYLCGRDLSKKWPVPHRGRMKRRNLATLDHLQPKSKGGSDYNENLRMCCQPCNTGRGNEPLDTHQLVKAGLLPSLFLDLKLNILKRYNLDDRQ